MFAIKGDPLSGFWIEAKTERLTTASLYEPDMDLQAAAIKSELDTVVKRMKAELQKPKQSIFRAADADRT